MHKVFAFLVLHQQQKQKQKQKKGYRKNRVSVSILYTSVFFVSINAIARKKTIRVLIYEHHRETKYANQTKEL
jgi:preprotein translocase subunit YajC